MNRLYPVIHVKSKLQAQCDFDAAWSGNADGVFLINMGHVTDATLYHAYLEIASRAAKLENFRVGINFLKPLDQIPTFSLMDGTMVWSDTMDGYNSSIRERCDFYAPYAFKYQKQPEEGKEKESLKWIENRADVVVTTGTKTGNPPTLDKIKGI